jgi:hypothetical protein
MPTTCADASERCCHSARSSAGLPSVSAPAFLGEDAVRGYLDRAEEVIVIWQDEFDRTAFARVAAVVLDFFAVEPQYYYSIAFLEIIHSARLLNL